MNRDEMQATLILQGWRPMSHNCIHHPLYNGLEIRQITIGKVTRCHVWAIGQIDWGHLPDHVLHAMFEAVGRGVHLTSMYDIYSQSYMQTLEGAFIDEFTPIAQDVMQKMADSMAKTKLATMHRVLTTGTPLRPVSAVDFLKDESDVTPKE